MMDKIVSAFAAVVRSKDLPPTIEAIQIGPLRADEVLVRIVATGICHTDMVMRDQGVPTPQPVVLGHEGAGVVEAVGDEVHEVKVGDHVVLTFNSCGHCKSCNEHDPAYCVEFFTRNFMGNRPDGTSPLSSDKGPVWGNIFGQSSFATYAVAHERNAVKVRADANLELLGPLGCGVMTGAGAVLNALKVRRGSTIAIFGTGAVGLSALLAAKAAGASKIVAIDRNADRLNLAVELGASDAVNPADCELEPALMEILPDGYDYALDTTGNEAVIKQAAAGLAVRGVLGLVGASSFGETLAFDAVGLLAGGRVVRGIVEGDADPKAFIPQLIEMHASGMFPFDRLVRFYDFNDIAVAIQDAESGVAIKPVVRMPRQA